tara:strand:- start:68 stop:517 length:450 start_codon:yes stop_codon:yes gene_type:complete
MAEKRTNRQHENRASQERPKTWTPPSTIPDVIPLPGFDYHWKRIAILNDPDPRNISMALREGYEMVKAEEQPHMKIVADSNSRYPGCIEIGGLVLCKIPTELARQKKGYYLEQADQQMQSVDNNLMRQSDPRAPIFKEHKSTVSFGKGK